MSTNMRANLVMGRPRVNSSGFDHLRYLVGYHVTLYEGDSYNDNSKLATAISKDDNAGGIDFLNYRPDVYSSPGEHRTLTIGLQDISGRHIPFAGASWPFNVNESGYLQAEDIDFEDPMFQWPVGDLFVLPKEAEGLLVTLGTGKTPITFGPGELASGWGLSRGNAVTILVDNDVYIHAAARFRNAQESILLSQLTFSLPVFFDADATREIVKVIFEFHPPPPDSLHPRAAGVGDVRPERLLLLKADSGVDVRILLHSYKLPMLLKILVGGVLFIVAGTDGISLAGGLLNFVTSVDEAKRYFEGAGNPNIKIQGFEQPLLNVGFMHARTAVIDGLHGICMGGSFYQSYVDTQDHIIDAPVRGASGGLPQHDVGIGVTGPAVGDMHRSLKLLWDKAAPNDPLENLPRNPPRQLQGGDGLCSIQIVRTLTKGHFENMEDGEKGVLEAYLRAIASAEDFIYLENQYFTNDRIGDALVSVMKKKRNRQDKPDLQVIVVLNIAPDIPLYPIKQRRLITRIRRAIGETPDNPRQFGVFTRWTHEPAHPPDQRRPRILPVYIHAKVGIVDDKWATVGSANLDGLSLDSLGLADSLNWLIPGVDPIDERRAIEINAVLLNETDSPSDGNVVKILRRKLWAEHLGCSIAPNVPDPPDCNLINPPPGISGGWLKLWNERSDKTLEKLRTKPSDPTTGMARVLPWPSDNTTHKTPRDYLTTLEIPSYKLVPLKSTREFDFEEGEWKEGSKAEMDYD